MSEFIEKIGIKKLIIMGLIIVGIVICVIAGSLLYNKFFYKKSYSDVENIMVAAAKSYYNNHKDNLPDDEGELTSVNVKKLVSDGYMNDINSYLKNDTTCKGIVNVTRIKDDYRYTPVLTCGDDYEVSTLTNYIQDNENVITSGDGLYSINNELVYRGENVNNYVTFGNFSWRIVKISEGRVMLIFNDRIENYNTIVWDNRYNTDKSESVGINDYSVSRIKDSLEELYNGELLFSDSNRLLLSSFDLYVGKRSDDDTDKTGLIEKSSIIENQYIGLLPAYDLMNASLDENCTYTVSPSCSNYNYLTTYNKSWWTATADKDSSYKAYKSSSYDSLSLSRTNSTSNVRPIVYLVSDAIYVDGDGTETNPYTFK